MQAVRRVFEASGVDGITADAVAEQAGISKASVFYYFDSMEQIFAELIASEMDAQATTLIEAVDSAGDGPSALGAAVRAVYLRYAEQPERWKLISALPQMRGGEAVGIGGRYVADRIDPGMIRFVDAVERKFQQTHPHVADPRQLAVAAHMSAIGALSLVHIMHAVGGGLRDDPTQLVERLASMLELGCDHAASLEARGSQASGAQANGQAAPPLPE